MEFSAELQNILGDHTPSEIEELILDDLFQDIGSLSINHKKALEQYTSLIHLSMKNIGLEKLDNFPAISSLQILELSNNKLTGKDFGVIPTLYPHLYKIKVGANKIESMTTLEIFKKTLITKIEIKGNPFVSKSDDYTEALFELLPGVKAIDGHDAKGQEVDSTNYDEEEEEESYDEDDQEEGESNDAEEGEEAEDDDEGDDDDEDE